MMQVFKKESIRKKILFILFVIFFLHLIFRIFTYRENYIRPFDAAYWEYRYNNSQWVVPISKNPIGDDGLFTHAAWRYVHGEDPSFIVPEYPPLGKYILGVTILLFNNQNIFAFLTGLLVLLMLYHLNLVIFKKNTLNAFLPVFLFSLEPLFYQQLRAPFFDLLYLLFFIITILFFIKRKYVLSSIFLGCFAAVKFPIPVFLVVGVCLSYLVLRRERRELVSYLLSLPIIVIIYIVSYFRFFQLGHSFFDFLALQKYIINFYAIGAKAVPRAIWEILLFGRWPTWFGTTQAVSEWQVTWPILFVISFVGGFFILKNRRSDFFLLIALWILGYLLFLTFIPAFPRYLLLILPFMYNLFIWLLPFLKNVKLK